MCRLLVQVGACVSLLLSWSVPSSEAGGSFSCWMLGVIMPPILLEEARPDPGGVPVDLGRLLQENETASRVSPKGRRGRTLVTCDEDSLFVDVEDEGDDDNAEHAEDGTEHGHDQDARAAGGKDAARRAHQGLGEVHDDGGAGLQGHRPR